MKSMWVMLALLCSFGVQAQEGPRRLNVDISDLDLNRPEGIHVAYHRIERAAVQVCEQPYGNSLEQIPRVRACQTQAIADAVSQVHNLLLSAYYQKHKVQGAS